MTLRVTTNNENVGQLRGCRGTNGAAIISALAQRSVTHWCCEPVQESAPGQIVEPRIVAIEHVEENHPVSTALPALSSAVTPSLHMASVAGGVVCLQASKVGSKPANNFQRRDR